MAEKINLAHELMRFKRVLKGMPRQKKIQFVFLFGSHARGKATPLSDIDVGIYYEGDKKERFKFRLALMSKLPEYFDIQIYQDLPLYIQPSVQGGRLLYARDISFVYATAYETIRRYGDFIKGYDEYIQRRKLFI